MKLIDKDALVVEIERRRELHYKYYMKNGAGSIAECKYDEDKDILSFLDTIEVKLEVKEVDLDALGVLAEHLIACDAHLITPKYTDKELNMLEEWAKNNKTQKGE